MVKKKIIANFLVSTSISNIFLLALPLACFALPGQNITRFQTWLKNQTILSQLTLSPPPSPDEAHPAFAHRHTTNWIKLKEPSIELRFNAVLPNGTVNEEFIEYSGAQINFDRQDTLGNNLIREVWGNKVLQDFISSRYTDSRDLECLNGMSVKVFLGQRYGYLVAPSLYSDRGVMSAFYVLEIDRWRYLRDYYIKHFPEADCYFD